MSSLQPADIEIFNRDGVVCLRGILNKHELGYLESGIELALGQIGATSTGYDATAVSDAIWNNNPTFNSNAAQYDLGALAAYIKSVGASRLRDMGRDATGHFLLDTGVWMRSEEMRSICLGPTLSRIAGALLDADSIRFYDDQIFVKQPGTAERTAFHQDLGYFNVDGDQGCVMWIAVDPATRQTGTMGYVRGSHRWGTTFKPNMFITSLAFPGAEGEDLPDIDNNEDKYDIVYFDVEPGDVIVHHFRTVHGSHGNASTTQTRRAASLRYVGEQVRYRKRPGAPAQPHRPLDWADGTKLCDPWFPLVWRRGQMAEAAE